MSSYKFYQKIDPLAGIAQIEGSGTPEGLVTGYIGQRFLNTDNNDLYIKSSGDNTNTGWQLINKLGWSGEVNTFADLPDVASNSGRAYLVKTSTGSISTADKKYAGVYLSNGTDWIILGYKQESVINELLNNFNPATSISAINSTDSIKVSLQKTQKYFNDFLTNFNGANQLVRLDSNGKLVAIDGSALVNINASQPTGTIIFTVANSLNGALKFDGVSSYSKTQYSDLYALISSVVSDDPNNANNFILPDPEGRALGVSGTPSSESARSLFQQTGVQSFTMSISQIPSHTHPGPPNGGGYVTQLNGAGSYNNGTVQYVATGGAVAGLYNDTGSTGSGSAINLEQPTFYVAKNLFIYF